MADINLKVKVKGVATAEKEVQGLIDKFNNKSINLNVKANIGNLATGLKVIAENAKLATLNTEKMATALRKVDLAGKNNVSKKLTKQQAPFKLNSSYIIANSREASKAIKDQTSTQVKEGNKQAKNIESTSKRQVDAQNEITDAHKSTQEAIDKTTKTQKKQSKEAEKNAKKVAKETKDAAKATKDFYAKETQAIRTSTAARATFKKNKHIGSIKPLALESADIDVRRRALKSDNSAVIEKTLKGEKLTADETSKLKAHTEQLSKLTAEQKLAAATADSMSKAIRDTANEAIAYDKIGSRLTEYYDRYGAQLKKNSTLMTEWQRLYNKAMSGDFKSIADANQSFAAFRMQARAAGIEMESFGTKLQRTFGSRVRSAMAGYGVFAMQTAVRDILRNAVEVDTAMTELKKVTDATSTEYAQFLDGAAQRAQKLGATLSETVNATAD